MADGAAERFVTHLRVRSYEMDSLGHVNNAVYLHYLEQAGWEHSMQLGFTLERYAELGGIFILRKMEIEYLWPAVAGDTLAVTTWVEEMRGPRAVRKYEIKHAGAGKNIVRATSLWAWVDRTTGRPRPIPPVLLDAFASRALPKEDGAEGVAEST